MIPSSAAGRNRLTVTEFADTTGSAVLNTTAVVPAGTLDFTDQDTGDTHTVSVALDSAAWSAGGSVPGATQADLAAAVTTTLHDSTGTGTGSVDWDFAIADQDLDFLADGETLTIDYTITVSDGAGSDEQTVSVVVTGTNDAVVMTGGPQAGSVEEQVGVTGSTTLDSTTPDPTGTLTFADVDLSNSHTVNVAMTSSVWSADPSYVLDSDTLADLQAALLTTLHDSTGTGTGGVDWSFAIQDRRLDFLAAGDTLTVTYDVTVSDGVTTSTQTVTITATGAEDPLTVNPATGVAADTFSVDTGALIASGNVISDAGDSGGDGSVTLSVSDVNGDAGNVGVFVAGTYGDLLVFSDGTYLFVANAAVDPLRDGDSGTDTFNFTVTDSLGRSQATTLTLNVQGTNDVPVIVSAEVLGVLTEDAGPTIAVNGGFESGDLTGWSSSNVTADPVFFGGEFGTYSARLAGSGFLEQNVATTAGQHYTLSFYLAGDAEAESTSITVYWDGVPILVQSNVALGLQQYTFDVVGDALDPTTQLFFDFSGDGTGMLVDQVSVTSTSGPPTQTTDGSIAFSDAETADTHTASFIPQASGYRRNVHA